MKNVEACWFAWGGFCLCVCKFGHLVRKCLIEISNKERSCPINCITLLRCMHGDDMMTSSNGNIFRVTDPLWWESTGHSPHKGQWRGPLMFSLICVWANGWANHRNAGDLRRRHAHNDVKVMDPFVFRPWPSCFMMNGINVVFMN